MCRIGAAREGRKSRRNGPRHHHSGANMESRGHSHVRRGLIAGALLASVAAPSALLAQAAAPAPPTVADLAKSVADTGAAINMVWTLVAGFLVMFMQLGFAMVETGFTRAKNAGHTV